MGMGMDIMDAMPAVETAASGAIIILLVTLLFTLAFWAFIIWLWYLISKEFYKIAKEKGYPQKKFLWLTFFLGTVGMLLVVALPDRGAKLQIEIPAAPFAAPEAPAVPEATETAV